MAKHRRPPDHIVWEFLRLGRGNRSFRFTLMGVAMFVGGFLGAFRGPGIRWPEILIGFVGLLVLALAFISSEWGEEAIRDRWGKSHDADM